MNASTPLLQQVRQRFAQSSYSPLRRLTCQVEPALGRLTVTGQVPSYFLKQMAQALLADITDTYDLVLNIEVTTPGD